MVEWVLLLTLSLAPAAGEVRDVHPSVLGGFRTRGACEAAGAKLAERLVVLTGRHREQQGIAAHTARHAAQIWTECIEIAK